MKWLLHVFDGTALRQAAAHIYERRTYLWLLNIYIWLVHIFMADAHIYDMAGAHCISLETCNTKPDTLNIWKTFE